MAYRAQRACRSHHDAVICFLVLSESVQIFMAPFGDLGYIQDLLWATICIPTPVASLCARLDMLLEEARCRRFRISFFFLILACFS